MQGTIKKLTDRGFGFIETDEMEDDIFFHARSLSEGLMFDELREGDELTFELEQTEKGPNAVQVARA